MSILLIHVLSGLLADSPHQFLVASLIASGNALICKVMPIADNAAVALSVAPPTPGFFVTLPIPSFFLLSRQSVPQLLLHLAPPVLRRLDRGICSLYLHKE